MDDPRLSGLDGFADIDAMRDRLVGTCRTSLRSLHSHLPHGDQTASAQRTAELVTRGIRVWTVPVRNRLLGPEGASMRGYLRAVVGLGEELRAAERLPMTQMILADRSAALIPVLGTPMTQAAVLIRSEEFVRPLEAVFQATWEQSEAVDISEADPLDRLGERSRGGAGAARRWVDRRGDRARTRRHRPDRAPAGRRPVPRTAGRLPLQLGLEVARRGWL